MSSLLKARELVLDYIASHSLSDKLNKAVNEVCRSRPQDPWLFLSDIISDWTKDVPLIDRLVAKQGIDHHGNPSIQLQLYGKVSSAHSRPPRYLGVQNVFMVPPDFNSADDSKADDDGDGDAYSECKVIMEKVSEFLSPALRSTRINEQSKIDGELIKMYQNLAEETKAYHLIPAISTLIAHTTANALRLPMYKYLARCRRRAVAHRKAHHVDEDAVDEKLPNLLVQITASKTNRDAAVYVVPKPTLKAMDRVRTITEIATALRSAVPSSKQNGRTPSGAVVVDDSDCENLEGLLTLIGGVTSNKDVTLCLSFSSNPSSLQFDKESGKYTIDGMETDGDGVVSYFDKLAADHPEIEYLEDPLHETDAETMALLTAKMRGRNVTVIGNVMYRDDESALVQSVENGMQSERTSAVMVSTSGLFTMTDSLKMANMMQQYAEKAVLMLSDTDFVANGIADHSVDLATACGAELIRLPMPDARGAATQYNRWLMIADDLAVDMEDIAEDDHEDAVTANGGPVSAETADVELANGSMVDQGNDKTEDLP